MKALEIKKDIYWVGAVDWNVRNFHGHTYNTKRGTTYNAYLIVDDKITLVDTVLSSFSAELIERIKEVIPIGKIDYIIANHVETDHSGALPEIMKLCPKAKIIGTAKCKEGLYKHYYGNWEFQEVKTNDKLKLGRKTLTFLEAPMLHWPDSMFTYCPEEELLLPNDAFGQHYATSERFDDQVDQSILMDEAAKYYGNILWPLSPLVLKKIEEVQKLNIPIKMIAPSHGVIWRGEPAKIITAYLKWSKNEAKDKVVVVYETMWGATEEMARAMVEGLSQAGVEGQLLPVPQTDHTTVMGELLESKGILIGSACHNRRPLLHVGAILEDMMGLKPVKKLGAAFGSYGWSNGAVQILEKGLQESGIEVAQPALATTWRPSPDDWSQAVAFGKVFGEKVKAAVG